MTGEPRPFSQVSTSAETEALLTQARDQAREIIAGALQEADRLRETARERGLDEGRALAVVREARAIGVELEKHRNALVRDAERDLLRLALGIATKVIKREIAAGAPVADANLRAAIALVARSRILEIRMNPADLARVSATATEPGASFVADPDIAPGGCFIRTTEGTVDARIETQLERLAEALLE